MYDRELFAIYSAIIHFRHILEGRSFDIVTNHKPLIYAFHLRPKVEYPKHIHHLEFISQYSTSICHVSEAANITADYLSRIEAIEASDLSKKLATEQSKDPTLKKYVGEHAFSLNIQYVLIPGTTLSLLCDSGPGRMRPIVPNSMQSQIFDSLHGLAHPGARATIKLIQ